MTELKGSEVILTFLGTGSSIPPLKRQQSSFVLNHQKGTIIFDCGEGTQYQMRKNKISTNKEFIICISHRHSDHTLGIPGLLSSFQLQGRTDKIIILGPSGIKEYINRILYAFSIRLDYPLEIKELYPGDMYESLNFTLFVHQAIHEAPGGALSLVWVEHDGPDKFDTDKLDEMNIPRGPHLGKLQRGETIIINNISVKPEDVMFKGRRGRVVAYTGDSIPNKEFMKNLPTITDILIHEGSFPIEMENIALERGHSTFMHAVEMALLGDVNQLILTHISPRFTYKQLKEDLITIKKIFREVLIAYDGMRYIIPLPEIPDRHILQ